MSRLCRLSSVAHLLVGENVEQLRSSPAPAATEMLCLWRRSFGGATPVTASPIVSQLRHFFSEFPALAMTMTLFAAGDLVADLRAGAPSCVINCSVTHYILLQKDGFNFFVNYKSSVAL